MALGTRRTQIPFLTLQADLCIINYTNGAFAQQTWTTSLSEKLA